MLAHIQKLIKAAGTSGAAWDISGFSYASQSYNPSSQSESPQDLAVNAAGTRVFVADTNGDPEVNQYNMTGGNLNSASYASKTLLLSGVTPRFGGLKGIFCKPDGDKIYLAGKTGGGFPYTSDETIAEISLSSANDLATASLTNSFDVGGQVSDPAALCLSSDGTKVWVLDGADETIHQYTLSTPWSFSSVSYDSKSYDVSAVESNAEGIFVGGNDDQLFVVGAGALAISAFTLSTPKDISTASSDSVSVSVSSQADGPKGLSFLPDGSKAYVSSNSPSDFLYQYE